jgi:hypothetical protein
MADRINGFNDRVIPLTIGLDTLANDDRVVAVGPYAAGYNARGTALGYEALAGPVGATAVGHEAYAGGSNGYSTALGAFSTVNGADYATALGGATEVTAHRSTAIGSFVTAGGADTVLASFNTDTGADTSVLAGVGITAPDDTTQNVLVGNQAELPGGASNAVVAGYQATAGGYDNTVVGANADGRAIRSTVYGNYALGNDQSAAFGGSAFADGDSSTALGVSTTAGDNANGATQATAIGYSSTATGHRSVAINGSVSTDGAGRIGVDQLVFGGSRDTVADGDLNAGEVTVELDEANGAFRLRGKDSGGTVREATVAW